MTPAFVPSTPVQSDQLLLERISSGDKQALEELFQRYRQPAFRVAYRLLGNEADALDAVQEGFIKALTRLQGFEGRSSFKTWFLRVIVNAALDLGRQRGRRETISLDSQALNPGPVPESLLVEGEAGKSLENEDLRLVLTNALSVLSDPQRHAFILFAEAGLSYREVAEVMETSIGTVMSRLYYARQKLRSYLLERDW